MLFLLLWVVKEGEDYNLLLMKIGRDGRDRLFDSIFAERLRKSSEPGTPPGSVLRAGGGEKKNKQAGTIYLKNLFLS